jgi:uncharacterized membrane protein
MAAYVKWIIAALSLSLMVNVFAAGHFFGQGVGAPKGKDGPQITRGLPRGAYRAMPAEAQEAFRAALKDARKQTFRNRRQVRALRMEIPEIIGRPGPLDGAALGQNFEELRLLNAGLQSRFETALLSALEVMSESERQAFAEQLKKGGKRRPRGGGPGGPGGPEGRPEGSPPPGDEPLPN